jgi:hypothetical protein
MKRMLSLAVIAMASIAYAQVGNDSESTNSYRPGDPSYLIPTQEQQDRFECNENAVLRKVETIGNYVTVKCTGHDGLFYLYAKYFGGGNNGQVPVDPGMSVPPDHP